VKLDLAGAELRQAAGGVAQRGVGVEGGAGAIADAEGHQRAAINRG
jgi:hypothetical protein